MVKIFFFEFIALSDRIQQKSRMFLSSSKKLYRLIGRGLYDAIYRIGLFPNDKIFLPFVNEFEYIKYTMFYSNLI
jgi:hypothetical protein